MPSPGDLSDPEIKLRPPTFQADDLPTELWGKPLSMCSLLILFIWRVFVLILLIQQHGALYIIHLSVSKWQLDVKIEIKEEI